MRTLNSNNGTRRKPPKGVKIGQPEVFKPEQNILTDSVRLPRAGGLNAKFDGMLDDVAFSSKTHAPVKKIGSPTPSRRGMKSGSSKESSQHVKGEGLGKKFSLIKAANRTEAAHYGLTSEHEGSSVTSDPPDWLIRTFCSLAPSHPLRKLAPQNEQPFPTSMVHFLDRQCNKTKHFMMDDDPDLHRTASRVSFEFSPGNDNFRLIGRTSTPISNSLTKTIGTPSVHEDIGLNIQDLRGLSPSALPFCSPGPSPHPPFLSVTPLPIFWESISHSPVVSQMSSATSQLSLSMPYRYASPVQKTTHTRSPSSCCPVLLGGASISDTRAIQTGLGDGEVRLYSYHTPDLHHPIPKRDYSPPMLGSQPLLIDQFPPPKEHGEGSSYSSTKTKESKYAVEAALKTTNLPYSVTQAYSLQSPQLDAKGHDRYLDKILEFLSSEDNRTDAQSAEQTLIHADQIFDLQKEKRKRQASFEILDPRAPKRQLMCRSSSPQSANDCSGGRAALPRDQPTPPLLTPVSAFLQTEGGMQNTNDALYSPNQILLDLSQPITPFASSPPFSQSHRYKEFPLSKVAKFKQSEDMGRFGFRVGKEDPVMEGAPLAVAHAK